MPRVWGGDALRQRYQREVPTDQGPIGESWEMSDRPEAGSRVRGGPWHGRTLHELWRHHRAQVFGHPMLDHPADRFPLLLKILDARQPLSVQVHPPAAVAGRLNGEPKDECWYVAHAEPGATIWAGLRRGVDRPRFEAALANGGISDLVHTLQPQAGQSLALPSGRVHALGAGLVVFEVQQNSDTTYRVFDWDRPGLDGRPRPLHIEPSLLSIDFDDIEPELAVPRPGDSLVRSPHFRVTLQNQPAALGQPRREAVIVALTEGQLLARSCGDSDETLTLHPGDFILLPATGAPLQWSSGTPLTRWLEIRPGDEVPR